MPENPSNGDGSSAVVTNEGGRRPIHLIAFLASLMYGVGSLFCPAEPEKPLQQASAKRHFTFLVASGRHGGNTEWLTRKAAESLPTSVVQQWLHLPDLPLPPFEDIRHSVGVYPEPQGNERILLDATLAASDLVFAVPLYWYSVPASAKLYLDHWSGWLRVPGVEFRARMVGRKMWGVCVLSEEDQRRADPLIGTLSTTADYMKMKFGGVLLGYGSRPGDILTDSRAIEQAGHFFRESWMQ